MRNIDERVVQMQFDNKQFESGIKSSVKSLRTLKSELQFEESSKNLAGLQKSINTVSLDPIIKGIDSLNSKFSAFGIFTITIMQNITNSIIESGKQLAKSFGSGAITEGYDDYKSKLVSVQTIMNATGEDIKTVSGFFKELDTYADKTIYNLRDMTSAFAKFTNAGIKMETSVPAIKGIANMVALAGQDANAAQIAFYNLSQSLSNGFLTTTDYKSLNLANVATSEWKDQVIQTAIAMGKLKKNSNGLYQIPGVKKAVNDAQLFSESLSEGWASAEVLLKVFGDYGNAATEIGRKALAAAQDVKDLSMMLSTLKASVATGWTDTFELIIGDLTESKWLFTNLTTSIGAFVGEMADARNGVLSFWKANGGRTAFFEAIGNTLTALGNIIAPIETAFRNIFPKTTGEQLIAFSKTLRDITSKFTIGAVASENLRKTFQGLFAIIDIGGKVLGFLFNVVGLLVKAIFPFNGGILAITGNIGDFLVAINKAIETNNIFGKALEKISTIINLFKKIIGPVITFIGSAFTKMKDEASGAIGPISNAFNSISEVMSKAILVIASLFKSINSVFKPASEETNKFAASFGKLYTGIINVIKAIQVKLSPLIEGLKEKFAALTFKDIGSLLTGGGFLLFAKTINDGLKSVDGVLGTFKGVLEEVGNTLKAFQLKIKAEAIRSIAISLAILAASIVALSFIPVDGLKRALGALTVIVIELAAILFVLGKIKDIPKMALQITALSLGLLLLSRAVITMGQLDLKQAGIGLGGLVVIMGAIFAFVKLLKPGDMLRISSTLISFSLGITVLSGAVLLLSRIDWKKGLQGLLGLGLLMGAIAIFTAKTQSADIGTSAGGLIAFSIGLNILVLAVSNLGKLPYDQLEQGMIALGVMMVAIAGFISTLPYGRLADSAGGLIMFSLGLATLAGVIYLLGKIDWKLLVQGGIIIAGFMLAIGGFIKLTQGKALLGGAGGLIAFSAGILVLASAFYIMGQIDLPKIELIGMVLIGLMVALTLFVTATNGLDLGATSIGMIALSVAVGILAASMNLIAMIDQTKLTVALGSIATLMIVIAAFVNITSSGDLAASSAGIMGFAAGILLLAGTIAILSALQPEKLILASAAISLLMVSLALFVNFSSGGKMVASIAGLLTFAIIIGAISVALMQLSSVDTNKLVISMAALAVGFGILIGVSYALAFISPELLLIAASIGILGLSVLAAGAGILAIGIAFTLFVTSITSLISAITALGNAGPQFMTGIEYIGKGADTIILVFSKILDTIIQKIPLIAKKIGEGIVVFSETIQKGLSLIVTVAANFIIEFIKTINTFIQPLIEVIVDLGIKILIGFIKGLSQNIEELIAVGIDLVLNFLKGIESRYNDIIQAGINMVITFINSMTNALKRTDEVVTAVNELVDTLIQSFVIAIVKNPLNPFTIGKSIIDGLVNGITGNKDKANMAAENLGQGLIDSTNQVLDIKSPSGEFEISGERCVDGLANGITNNEDKAINAATDMSQQVADAPNVIEDVTKTAGESLVDNLANGITDNKDKAVNAMKDVVDKVIEVPKKALGELFKSGQKLTTGFSSDEIDNADIPKGFSGALLAAAKGFMPKPEDLTGKSKPKDYSSKTSSMQDLQDTADKEKEIRNKAFQDAIALIDEEKYYKRLSLEQELVKWQELQAIYDEGSEERKKVDREVYRVKGDLVKAGFDHSVQWIDNEKYYKKLSLEEELAAWERVQTRYLEGTDERKKADSEIYRLKNDLIKETFDNSVKAINDEKYFGTLSAEAELERWGRIQQESKEGSDQRIQADKEIYRIKKELIKEEEELEQKQFENKVKLIEDAKFYNNLSLEEELAKWKEIQTEYADGTDQRIEANKQVYKLNKEIVDANNDYIKKKEEINSDSLKKEIKMEVDYSEKVKDIEDSSNEKRLDINKDYYDKVEQIQENHNEKRKKLDDDYYEKTAEIKNKLEEDIDDTNAKYEDAVNSRTQSLYSAYGLFDRIGGKERISGETLTRNLKGQLQQFDVWQNSIATLTKKGIDEGLLKELEAMGPQAAYKIEALSKMSDEKLKIYVNLWKTKHTEAKDQSVSELDGMRVETISKVDQLKADSNIKLEEYKTIWSTQTKALSAETLKTITEMNVELDIKLTKLNTDTSEQLSDLKTDFNTNMTDLKNNTTTQLSELTTNFNSKMRTMSADATIDSKNLNSNVSNEFKDLNTTVSSQAKDLNTNVSSETKDLNTNVSSEIKKLRLKTEDSMMLMNENVHAGVRGMSYNVQKEITTLAASIQQIMRQPDWTSIGANVVNGFINGMYSKLQEAGNAAASVALSAYYSAMAALGIQSPSKKFEEIGMYADEGFAQGLNKFSGVVSTSAEDVGKVAISSLQETISNISDVMNNNLDTNPVIRPVLDMSDIVNGGKQIDGLFTKNQGINLSNVSRKIPNIETRSTENVTDTPNSAVSFVQNNYSPKELSRLDIYRQTNNQISIMKGLVTT